MAKLTAKKRKNLSAGTFGIKPTKGSPGKYPMPDKSHAANAKARATQQVNAGNLSPSAKAKIDAKANKMLDKKPKVKKKPMRKKKTSPMYSYE